MAKGTCPIIEYGKVCDRPVYGRSLCNKHWQRLRHRGSPYTVLIRDQEAPFDEWFWSKLTPPTATGCREWTGARQSFGHGSLMGPDGSIDRAHRIAWRLTYGAIPAGLFICHRCDNPPCCEPTHLFVGTSADNMADMVRKGRGRNRYGKIPDAVKDEIRARLAAGDRVTVIARDVGVSYQSVSSIKNGRAH